MTIAKLSSDYCMRTLIAFLIYLSYSMFVNIDKQRAWKYTGIEMEKNLFETCHERIVSLVILLTYSLV